MKISEKKCSGVFCVTLEVLKLLILLHQDSHAAWFVPLLSQMQVGVVLVLPFMAGNIMAKSNG